MMRIMQALLYTLQYLIEGIEDRYSIAGLFCRVSCKRDPDLIHSLCFLGDGMFAPAFEHRTLPTQSSQYRGANPP